MLLRCTDHMVNWYAAGVSQPLISYKCWDIRTIHQTDIIGETRGEIFFLFHCLEDTGFVFDDPRETGKESSCVCFVFTFSRHMERRTECFDLWTYSEYRYMNLIILHCLISWCMSTLKSTRFALVNVGYVYFLWPSYPHEAPCMQRKQIFIVLLIIWIEGQAVFCVEIIILYLIYLPFFV